MRFSVLGVGTSFVESAMAETHGFADCDMNSQLLSPRLRRRMSSATRLALTAGERACADANVDVSSVPSVFASIAGEIKVTDTLCRNIAGRDFPLSPTQFHNSVHNTAAGYWSMVTKNKHAAQALGAGENTWVMGLLESCCQLRSLTDKVLLICYEEAAPEPLVMGEQISDCAVAMLLGIPSDKKRSVCIYQQRVEHAGASTELWSPVSAALALAKAVRHPQNSSKLPISSTAHGWYAEVVHGE